MTIWYSVRDLDASRQFYRERLGFTELMFDAGLESRDGLWALRASGLAGWSIGIEHGLYFRARTDVGLERVVLAVADQPVVLQVSGA